LGEALGGDVAVRLFLPPPLDTELTLQVEGEVAQLLDGDTVVAKAWRETTEMSCSALPSFSDAVAAAKHYIGHTQHPFPGCFVCGPNRDEGDGLRIFPGHLPESDLVAAPWIPHRALALSDTDNRLDRVFLWAALDCTSAFPMLPLDEGKALVLGQMAVQIKADVTVGEHCVMLGWPVDQQGKKYHSASAVIKQDGTVAALAQATWIAVEARLFQ
jgi:hypothetical protein